MPGAKRFDRSSISEATIESKRTEAEAQALFDKLAVDPVALLADVLQEAALSRAGEPSPTTLRVKLK